MHSLQKPAALQTTKRSDLFNLAAGGGGLFFLFNLYCIFSLQFSPLIPLSTAPILELLQKHGPQNAANVLIKLAATWEIYSHSIIAM